MKFKRAKSILLVSHEMSYTGAPASLLRISKILLKRGYFIEVWSLKDGDFKQEYRKFGIDVKIVSKKEYDKKEIIDKIKTFDFAICNTIVSGVAYNRIKEIIPAVWYIREGQNIPNWHNKLNCNLLENDKHIYCVSEYAQEFIEKNYNNKIHVCHNCVEDLCPEGNIVKTFEPDKLNILTLGTVQERKGMDIVIAAILSLPKEYSQRIVYKFAGPLVRNPVHESFYEPLLKEIENYDNIEYLGEIKDLNEKIKAYNDADIVCVPSRDESCSLVALEGIMMGRPILVSQNVGAKYLVKKNTGWIFETGNVNELAQIMKDILDNKYDVSNMGIAARKQYLRMANMDIYEKNIIKLVKDNMNLTRKIEIKVHGLLKAFNLTNILQGIFSVRNSDDKRHKVVSICGLKCKLRRKYEA